MTGLADDGAPVSSPEPVRTLVCAAAQDEGLTKELAAHLSELVRQTLIVHYLLPREPRRCEESLDAAEIAIILLSPWLLASSVPASMLTDMLARQETGALRVVPVLVRPCYVVTKYQVLPRDGRAVSEAPDRDRAWVEIVAEIEKIASAVQRGARRAPAAHGHDEVAMAVEPVQEPIWPDQQWLYDMLCQAGLESLLTALVFPYPEVKAHLPGKNAPLAERADAFLTWAGGATGPGLPAIARHLLKLMPHLRANTLALPSTRDRADR